MTWRYTRGDLQRIDVIGNQFDILGTADLRDQDAVETGADHRCQIAERQAASERVDPYQKRPVARRRSQQALHHAARERLAWRRDGILQVENQRVGADTVGLRELALAVGRHKQKRTQFHAGRLIISPVRRQYAISSLR